MVHITRRSIQECIMAAYTQYLLSREGTIICNTTDNGRIAVHSAINNGRFNCGIAGFNMSVYESNNLKTWCISHPGNNWSFGFRDIGPNHPSTLNIILINKTPLMFNFHVNVYFTIPELAHG